MDAPRLGLIQQQERQARTPFEGQPVAYWQTGCNESLPPPSADPRPQKPAQHPPKVSNLPMTDRQNMELVVTAAGKRKWMISAEALAEVRRRIAACDSLGNIARSMRLSPATVTKVAKAMRAAAPAVPDAGHLLQLPLRPGAHTRSPAPAPAPAGGRERGPQSQPQSQSHAQRLHVLEWAARLGRIEFSAPEQQHKPKKGLRRSHSRGYTADQMNNAIRSNCPPTAGMVINSKPRVIVQSIAKLFA